MQGKSKWRWVSSTETRWLRNDAMHCRHLMILVAGLVAIAGSAAVTNSAQTTRALTQPATAPAMSRPAQSGEVGEGVPDFWVRPGYRVSVAVDGLDEARFLEFDDRGTLFVSQPMRGRIIALRDEDGDGVYEKRTTFLSDRPTVHGMHFKDGWLWFTQTDSVHRARDTNDDGVADEVVTVLKPGSLARGGGHPLRSILVTDDSFYTSIGARGNIDEPGDSRHQQIERFDLDGSNMRVFSTGLRNTMKLRLRPGTSEIWGVDHGSDNFGQRMGEQTGRRQPVTDLNPPDEFNHYVEGGFYGHPWIVGNKLPRPEYLDRADIIELADRTIAPAWSFGAHWASNGFTFLTSNNFPDHQGDAVVAFHGSWNSVDRVGYRVDRILFDRVTGKPFGSQMLVSTIGRDGRARLARPCDCVEAPDGTILFSDTFGPSGRATTADKRVYRISRVK